MTLFSDMTLSYKNLTMVKVVDIPWQYFMNNESVKIVRTETDNG